jgi:light-regulated signal transduction histidine kinase (bacteriophytochrome)
MGVVMKDENTWEKTNEELQSWMRKEISTMREILANFHLESDAPNENQRKQLVEERASLMEKLKEFRMGRNKTIQKLKKISGCTEEELFAKVEKTDAETIVLRDQIIALLQRINHESGIPHTLAPQLSPFTPKPQKKNGLATIDTWEEKKPQD